MGMLFVGVLCEEGSGPVSTGFGVFGRVADDAGGDREFSDDTDDYSVSGSLKRKAPHNPWMSDDGTPVDDDDTVFGADGILSADDAVIPYRRAAATRFHGDQDNSGTGADRFDYSDDDSGTSNNDRLLPILALKADVETSTSNAVLVRARAIAARADSMFVDPTYDADQRIGYAELQAKVHGTTSPSSRYQVTVRFDMETGEVAGGHCTCPAYGRGYGMCKHMAALALAFADEPQRFDGYHAGAARPSRALIAYMERVDERETQARARRRDALLRRSDASASSSSRHRSARGHYGSPGHGGYRGPKQTVEPGQVHLTPILSFIDGYWSVEFKIGSSSNGSGYVLKSIPRFTLAMERGEHVEYGQKLAFTHTPDMLDAESRSLLGLLADAVAVRHAAEQQDRYYGHIAIDRHLSLSEAEVARLLGLLAGGSVQLVLDSWFSSQPSTVMVDGGEPEMSMSIVRRDFKAYGPEAGYLLTGRPALETVINAGVRISDGLPAHDGDVRGSGAVPEPDTWLLLAGEADRGYAAAMSLRDRRLEATRRKTAAGCRFVRCPKSLRPLAGIIADLFAPDSEGQVIAGDDMALFARTLMPQLVAAGVLDGQELPRELAALGPVECRIGFYLDRSEQGVECVIKARYGDTMVSILPDGPAVREDGSEAVDVVGRDYDTEHVAVDVVRGLFTMPQSGTSTSRRMPEFRTANSRKAAAAKRSDAARKRSGVAYIDRDDTKQLVRLFDEGLAILHDVGDVFTTPAFDRMLAPKPPTVKVGLSVKGNLVEISPIADEVPADEVGSLLASYRRRQRFHQLKDGTLVKLDGAHLNTLDTVARELDLDENQLNAGLIELPGGQAFLLDGELPDDGSDVVKDASFSDYIDDLKTIDPNAYTVPDGLKLILRPYQVEGFRWLNTLYDKGFGGILADEMGLGKSVQLIALLLSRYQNPCVSAACPLQPSLIVCPASLVYNWANEFAKFAPSFNAVVVAGSKAERRSALVHAFAVDEPTVLITSYDLLRRDADDYRAENRRFDIMTLDEAQYIKNHTTKIAKAVKSVDADHRFALTGTPIENRLSELWSIFDFLMPGLLGSYKRFHERYELPIANARAADDSTQEGLAAAKVNRESARVAHRLQSLIGVFIKRRLKSQVLTDLPDKLETTLTVQLEGEQRKLYAAHEQRLRMQLEHSEHADFNTSKMQILAELTKLRQICCDPRLLYANAKDQSAKLAAIGELLETCVSEGKKALIFSQFTSFLELIGERLETLGLRYYTINGSTPKKRRLELVDKFNADDTPAFLISLKAGNTGLNLIGASVVIHADPWWNAAAQNQATDRAHRIGQTQDVNVVQVVAKDTIEERILELQHTKSELARQFTDASLEADETGAFNVGGQQIASIASLTKDDLLGLLG